MNESKLVRSWLLGGATAVTAVILLLIAFNVPWVRGPEEWRWAYVIPGTLARLWISVLVVGAYVLGAGWWLRQPRPVALSLLLAGIMTPLIQLSLLTLEHPDVRAPLFYRTVSEEAGGFYNVGAVITDNRDFLAHFAERMPSYPVHPQRHPPGVPLLFAWTRQALDERPSLAQRLSEAVRPYQCTNLPLMNLPNSAIAAAVLQMSVPFWLGLVVVGIYFLGKAAYDGETAVRAALLWPLLPSVGLWATRWNHLYALFTLAAFLCLHLGLRHKRAGYLLASGLIVSLSMFFSFGNAVLVGLLGVYALVWLVLNEGWSALWQGWTLVAGGLFLAALAPFWLWLGWAYGLYLPAIWRQAMDVHLGIGRSYTVWLFYHLYDFLLFLGIPLVFLGAAQFQTAVTARPRRDVLTIAFVLGLVLLDLSGTSQGEVARVWAFLLPLALLTAVRALPANSRAFTLWAGLLAVQLLVSNIFLRPVGTGLTDPPPAPETVALSTSTPRAVWTDGLVLANADFPAQAAAGATVTVTAVWDSQAQPDKPYTIFWHILNAAGDSVAQWDGQPRGGTWPTTCWQANHPFSDSYTLVLPPDLPRGDYSLEVGFYWLESLERTAVLLPANTPNNSVPLGIIHIP